MISYEYRPSITECQRDEQKTAEHSNPQQLKPCPFCGMDAELRRYKANGNDWWYVACSRCEIAIDPLMWNNDRTKEEVIKIWNRRVKE